MSLILEALRKSEAERRRGQAPGLHTELPPLPVARARGIPWWAWTVPATMALLGALWLARSTMPAVVPRNDATIDATVAPAPREAAPLPAVQRLVPAPTPVARIPAAAPTPVTAAPPAAEVATSTPPARMPAAASMPSLPLPPPPAPADDGIAASDPGVMSLSDLAPESRKALPPLKLSMHMWNDNPAQRFVILDGNRLGEGDRIGQAIITAITRDGVVLDWNGRRLKLSIR
jgi:general secretion pathway protein B